MESIRQIDFCCLSTSYYYSKCLVLLERTKNVVTQVDLFMSFAVSLPCTDCDIHCGEPLRKIRKENRVKDISLLFPIVVVEVATTK